MHPEIEKLLNGDWWSEEITVDNYQVLKAKIPTEPGIYRILTNAPIDVLQSIEKRTDEKHYNFKKKIEGSLKIPKSMLITQKDLELYCVYNGESYKLRQRFHEHFNGVSGNACLAIFTHDELNKYKWRFEFIAFPDLKDNKIYRTLLEQNLRAKYGWPILCDQ